ncbi:diguanylate cyclase domain-containing protein [Deinococcus depolymerans]|uniref:GGDEF domain-containing protein n=1 Tax=Deinococcus depolymerans TaxID=392408 RepID=A0ABN1CPH0_9DEIO
MTHRHLEDDLFHLLPLPALRWPAHAPSHAQPNHAYRRSFHPAALPARAVSWPDGTHQTRLPDLAGERRVCRLTFSRLPNGDRVALIEDVHTYHLDPVTRLPNRDALLRDAAQTDGVATLAALRLPPLHDQRRQLGDAPVDQALRHMARDLTRAARTWNASAYRSGTDEFTLLTPRPLTPEQLAPLLRSLEDRLGPLGRCAAIRAGLSDAPHDGRTLTDLLEAAQDRAGPHRSRRGALDRLRRLLRATDPGPVHRLLAL